MSKQPNKNSDQDFPNSFTTDLKNQDPAFYLLLGFAAGILITVLMLNSDFLGREFIDSLAPEAIGIIFTILILDRLSERREARLEFIREMRSHHYNNEALRGAWNLHKRGWLYNGSLIDTDLANANLKDVKMCGAVLEYVYMEKIIFERGDLQCANFRRSYFKDANFEGANCRKTDFTLAKLQGAKFSDASLIGAVFTGAIFDETTILPDNTLWSSNEDMSRFTDPNHPNFWRSDDSSSPAYHGKE